MPRLRYFDELNDAQRTAALAMRPSVTPDLLCYVIDVNGAILKTLEIKPIFETGEVRTAKHVSRHLIAADRPEREFLIRHANGDWSEMDFEEEQANRQALREGGQIMSRYEIAIGTHVYVLTRNDRRVTNVFLSTIETITIN